MPLAKRKVQGVWTSRWTFFAAAVALAAGLGDFWSTPLLIAESGGGLYLACYLFCLVAVVMPLAIAELRIAIRARANPVHAVDHFAVYAKRSRLWLLLPVLAMLVVLILAARLAVVGGWLLAYVPQLLEPEMRAASLDTVAGLFAGLLSSPERQRELGFLFLALVALFSSLQVGRGLAVGLRVLLPLLIAVLLVLVYYAYQLGDAAAAHRALLEVRPEQFGWRGAFSALQQAFYTLCVGSFSLMAYGAYFPAGRLVGRQIGALVVLDVSIMLSAGLLILALVADQHILPAKGPGLLFISLPYAFGNLVFGDVAGAAFFALLGVFVFTSAVALIEPVVAHLVERWALPRWVAAPAVVAVVALLASAAIADVAAGEGGGLWLWLDTVSAVLLLPLCALLFSIFAGWRIPRVVYGQPDKLLPKMVFWLWYQLLRYIAPPALLLILVLGCYGRFTGA